MRATGSASTRGSEVEDKTIRASTWLMEGERRMLFDRDREQYDAKCYLSVYVPRASSMQLHTFMLGIDVARRAFLLISTPPF